jgi:putative ABC transport system substrate-binding protein
MNFSIGLSKIAMAVIAIGLVTCPMAMAEPAPGVHRIAFINSGPKVANETNLAAFQAGLAELGYVEGRNLFVTYGWGDQKVEQLPALVNELLSSRPEVIVSTGGPVTARAVANATSTIPIVFITGDPLAEKLVPNMARPGGNASGFSVMAGELEAKRLEILQQLLPRAKRVAVIWNPTAPYAEGVFRNAEEAANRLDLTLLSWKAGNRAELEQVFTEIVNTKVDALFVVSDPVLGFERARIVEFASKNRLPGIYFWREFAEIGGLASYGTNLAAMYRQSASYVDKILKGAKPGDLPVQQPTTFEFVVNLKTAEALGVVIPNTIRQRADQVIQ